MTDELFHHSPAVKPELMQPLVLAYIGDAVYDLYIRQYLISQGNHKPHQLHRAAASYVSAKSQAAILRELVPALSEEEIDIVKRGRNAKSGSQPKNTEVTEYRQSTGFEALVGYLFLLGREQRLKEILDDIIKKR